MTSAVSNTEIQQLIVQVNAGNYTAAYNYLSMRGYAYADWANGVAQGNSIAGISALEFLQSTAMTGNGQTLSSTTIESIRQGMAREYLNVLAGYAQDNGGMTAKDINAQDVWQIHDTVFKKNGLSIENWTLNAPFKIYQKLYGDLILEDFWVELRETGGTGVDAMAANSTVLVKMYEFTQSSDPAIRAQAENWLGFVPSIATLGELQTLLSVVGNFALTTALNLDDFLQYLGGSTLDFLIPPAYGTPTSQFTLNINPNILNIHTTTPIDPSQSISQNNSTLLSGVGYNAIGIGNVNLASGISAWFNNSITDNFRPGAFQLAPVSPTLTLSQSLDQAFSTPVLTNMFNNAINGLSFYTPTDPLLLDLNGDGVRLTNYGSNPVLFDIDHDGGSKEQTGWVSAQDGMVVYDLNNNGIIDGIHETLSEYFNGAVGSNGAAGEKKYRDGFAALKSLNANT